MHFEHFLTNTHIHTHAVLYRNRKSELIGRVMESSGLGRNCFQSIMLMEMSEFPKKGEVITSKKEVVVGWFLMQNAGIFMLTCAAERRQG